MFFPCPLSLCGWCTVKADVKATAPETVKFGGRVWLAKTSINHRQIWASVCSKRTPEETSSTPLTPDGLRHWRRNSTKHRTILLKCHQECQQKSHTPPGTDSRASSSLPQCTGFVNNSPARSKGQLHPGWLSLAMLLQAASKPDNHFQNKMEIQGLIFANIINSFFLAHSPFFLYPPCQDVYF